MRSSSGVGLLAGGAQRTTALIHSPVSLMPSSRETALGCEAKPASWSTGNRKSPEPSPVKRPPGAVGAVRAGRQAERQHARLLVAEGGHGLAPVLPVRIGAAADAGHLGAVRAQPRAAIAGHDSCVQNLQCGSVAGHMRNCTAHALVV